VALAGSAERCQSVKRLAIDYEPDSPRSSVCGGAATSPFGKVARTASKAAMVMEIVTTAAM